MVFSLSSRSPFLVPLLDYSLPSAEFSLVQVVLALCPGNVLMCPSYVEGIGLPNWIYFT